MMMFQYREQYERFGYAIAPQLLTPSEIAGLTALVDPIYRKWLQDNQGACVTEQLINMHSLTHPRYFEHQGQRIQFFNAIASNVLTSLLEMMFGRGLYFHNTQLFFDPHSQDKQPYWHRDMQYSPVSDALLATELNQMLSFHLRIPLVPETGVELIPATHQRWDTPLERNVRLELKGHHNTEDLPHGTLIALSPGDILIFSANMIHRGHQALNPCRKALDLCLGKFHPLMIEYLEPDILPTEAELSEIDYSDWYEEALAIAKERESQSQTIS